MSYNELSRDEKNELLDQWQDEAKNLLRQEGVKLAGNALKYYLKGYIAERKEQME